MTTRIPHLVSRLQGFGTSVFSEMTALALRHQAVNLGQGFPDTDPPSEVVEAAQRAMVDGHNQYAPGPGVPALRAAIAAHQERFHGLTYDPEREVTVTFGATEAVAATLLAVCEVGDEVVVLEPTYDAYPAVIAMAGAVERRVPLTAPSARVPPPSRVTAGPHERTGDGPEVDGGALEVGAWHLDVDRLAAAIGPRTRVLLLNSPHNPSGMVLDVATLDAIAELCVAHDLIAVTDEVYEHLVFEGSHVPLATRPGMRERTVTISSAGKTFSCTGWKVGWACAPPALTAAVRTTKQFLSFSGATPFQHAIAVALASPDEVYGEVTEVHRQRRDLLVDGLQGLGVPVTRSAGTYFVTADLGPLGHADADAFCRWAPAALGVAGIPVSAFVRDTAPVQSLVRFAICKPNDVLADGVRRLGGAGSPAASPARVT
jgi:N-succinyldiaminopimelate aminotransferase